MDAGRSNMSAAPTSLMEQLRGRRVFYAGAIDSRFRTALLGGQRVTLEHVQVLREAGVEAFAVTSEDTWQRTRGRLQGALPAIADPSLLMHMRQFRRTVRAAEDVVVVPARQFAALDQIPGEHKVLFSQGIWVTMQALTPATATVLDHPALRAIMVVSDGNAAQFRTLQPTCPVLVARNGIDLPAHAPLREREACLAYPGLNRMEKNPWHTRALLVALARRGVLAPAGAVQALELEGIRQTQVHRHLETASALLFPSVWEGLGLLPLEAMARGCLAFGWDVSPMNEYLLEACRFSFADLDVMTDALESALRNPAAWQTQREAGIEVARRWSREAQARSILTTWAAIAEQLRQAA